MSTKSKKPAAKPVAKKPVAKKPAAKKSAPAKAKPAAKPAAKKPVAKPAAKPAAKKSVAKPATKPAAQTAASDLSKQAGSVSERFSSDLCEEKEKLRRYARRLFVISLIPAALALLSALAWALWLR